MTYCFGILLKEGLVFASDSRTNAGVDQISLVRKLSVFGFDDERTLVVLSAGNLATTQSVITLLQTGVKDDTPGNLLGVPTMFDAARTLGDTLREVVAREASFVSSYGSPDASFIIGGQIRGEPPRLFQIYSAGNFIEASDLTPFVQIGETKYGKPILDRIIRPDTDLINASKCAILSMDATIRSNLSVAHPVDMFIYRTDSFVADGHTSFADDDPYWTRVTEAYNAGLWDLFGRLDPPPFGQSPTVPPPVKTTI